MNTQRFLQAGLFLYILAAPITAQAAVADGGFSLGAGRLLPSVAAILGLIGVIIGRIALRYTSRYTAIVAIVLGLIALVIGGLHAANSAGGFGTGNGLAGAIVAMVLGLISAVLGGLALARSRKTAAKTSDKERTL